MDRVAPALTLGFDAGTAGCHWPPSAQVHFTSKVGARKYPCESDLHPNCWDSFRFTRLEAWIDCGCTYIVHNLIQTWIQNHQLRITSLSYPSQQPILNLSDMQFLLFAISAAVAVTALPQVLVELDLPKPTKLSNTSDPNYPVTPLDPIVCMSTNSQQD